MRDSRKNVLAAGLALLALACVSAAPALAQRTPVFQSGVLAAGEVGGLAKYFSNGLIGSGGGLLGDANGNGIKPFVVTDSLGLGVCTRDADTAARREFCFGHDVDGNALLTIDSYGGASVKGFKVRLNGVMVDFTGGAGFALLAPTRVYVSTTGNDANSCLTTLLPCATLQRALTAGTALLNASGGSLYIKMAAGSYTQSLFVNGPLSGSINSGPNPNGTNAQPGQVVVEGDGSATTTLTGGGVCATIASSNFANVAVRALRLVGNGVGCQSSLFAQMSGIIHGLDDIDFGPAAVEHIHLENGGQFQGWYSYKISGGAERHITAGQSAVYIHSAFPSGVISFVGTPTFTEELAFATQAANIQWNDGVTWSGSFIGRRYLAINNGVIQANPSTSYTWIPGTIAGYANSGGVYQGPFSVNIIGAVASDGVGGFHAAVCEDIPNMKCTNVAWTPVLRFGGLTTGITYSAQRGFYSQYNKVITAVFDFTLTSKGSATGSAGIAGLPVTSHNDLAQPCTIGYYANTSGIVNFTASYVNNASVVVELAAGGATGITTIADTNFENTTRISGRCTYAAN